MKARCLAVLAVGSVAMVACGGGRQSAPVSPSAVDGSESPRGYSAGNAEAAAPEASAAPRDSAADDYAPPAPAAAMPESQAASGRGAEPAARKSSSSEVFRPRLEPEARWGLATSWGETLSSPVSNVPFARDSESPFVTSALYYNDARGVAKMAGWPGDGATSDGAWLGGAFRVRLLDESGNPLPSWQSGSRTYTVGEEGRRYVIQIENRTSERVEALATVDGLDVIDGRPGSYSKRGYLINPWSTLEIDGFRRSEHSVAAFRFGAVPDSYAARKGDARNVGVIGVALFRERGASPRWPDREVDRRHSADPFPGRYAAPPPSRIVH